MHIFTNGKGNRVECITQILPMVQDFKYTFNVPITNISKEEYKISHSYVLSVSEQHVSHHYKRMENV